MLKSQLSAHEAEVSPMEGPFGPAHLDFAYALERSGRAADAQAAFAVAARSDPASLDARLGGARALMRLGRTAEAFEEADAALALDPENASAWALVADALAALGEPDFAAQACAQAALLAPDAADLRVRLGQLLEAAARPLEAGEAYAQALALGGSATARLEAHVSLSGLYGRAKQFALARAQGEAALEIAPRHQGALQNLAAICDHMGETQAAEAHRERAYRGRALIVQRAARPRRRVLTLASAGRANSPDRHLIPTARYDRLIWFPAYSDAAPREEYDVVFNAIGEPDAREASEDALAAFVASCPRTILNPPQSVARTTRAAAAVLFSGVASLVAPQARKIVGAADLAGLDPQQEWLRRPAGAHGGEALERLTLAQAGQGLDGRAHYLTAFHDFRSPDGFYRKYRMFFVDREPFPYHLAIRDQWLVHYQTSLTPSRADFLAEESRFLETPRAALGEAAYGAIAEVGRRLDLDFAGVDFTVLPDGRALLFEANATMLVHDEPATGPLAFKNPFVRRILEAFWSRLEGA